MSALHAIIFIAIGAILTYIFLNPTKTVSKNEKRELEALEDNFGEKLAETIGFSSPELEPMIERYMYLRHKYGKSKKPNTKK